MRRVYFVMVDKNRSLVDSNIDGRYTFEDSSNYGVFFREDYANAFGEQLARANPGMEVYVLTIDHGFYNSVMPNVVQKHMTPEGYV